MRFAVIGVGGVGGYVAARLMEAGHDVLLLARGEHRTALERDGLRVTSPLGDVHRRSVKLVPDGDPVDCVIIAVKTWQVAEAAASAAPLLGPSTVVLPLQNGVEAAGRAAAVVGSGAVLGGVAKIISSIGGPGHIIHTGVLPLVSIGEIDGHRSERVDALAGTLAAVQGLRVEVPESIERVLWEKFLFITAWASVGAVTRAPLGVVRGLPETRRLLEACLTELEQVARRKGIPLAADVVPATLRFIDRLPPEGTASMQRDIAAGKPSELLDLTGAAVRLGQELSVPTPASSFLLAALLPLERRARGEVVF